MKTTSIEWCDFSANPLKYRDAKGKVVWACVKKSSGCAHCYAETIAHHYGRGGPFTRATMEGLTPFLDDAELRKTLTAKRIDGRSVAGSRVFLGDMTDVFGDWVPDELLDRLFAAIALRTDVTFQVLTKRADRMCAYWNDEDTSVRIADQMTQLDPAAWGERRAGLFEAGRDEFGKLEGVAVELPLPNLWLGVSAEHQAAWDERIPHLRRTPAAIRFVSAEPLLGTIDPAPQLQFGYCASCRSECFILAGTCRGCGSPARPLLDWLIVGGESGGGSRPLHIEHMRSLVQQCQAAGVACFVKQVGADPISLLNLPLVRPDGERLRDKKGGSPDEWPSDLRVRQFPTVPA